MFALEKHCDCKLQDHRLGLYIILSCYMLLQFALLYYVFYSCSMVIQFKVPFQKTRHMVFQIYQFEGFWPGII